MSYDWTAAAFTVLSLAIGMAAGHAIWSASNALIRFLFHREP